MVFITVLSVIGLCVAFVALPCSAIHGSAERVRSAFGVIPWSIVGMGGYIALTATSAAGWKGVTLILASVAMLVTFHLMRKARELPNVCPLCVVAWVINLVIFAASLGDYIGYFQPR